MKLYCQIESKKDKNNAGYLQIVKGPMELPVNSDNISNLCLLDEETLRLFGWVPYEKQSENKEIFVSSCYEISTTKVLEKIITRDKSPEEIQIFKEKQNYLKWQEVRKDRNDLLEQSDKLVLADRWEKLSDLERQKLSNYRQLLRDLPSQHTDPEQIKFPTL